MKGFCSLSFQNNCYKTKTNRNTLLAIGALQSCIIISICDKNLFLREVPLMPAFLPQLYNRVHMNTSQKMSKKFIIWWKTDLLAFYCSHGCNARIQIHASSFWTFSIPVSVTKIVVPGC